MRPTEVIFLIDKSSSMSAHQEQLFRAYQTFIEKQKGITTDCYVTCELFSANNRQFHMNAAGLASNVDVETICAKTSLDDTPLLHQGNFHPLGGTPILDAIGITIDRARFMISDDTNRQVVLVLITDGEENQSKQYDPIRIAGMINQLRKGGWKFVYIKMDEKRSYLAHEDPDVNPFEMGFHSEEYFELEGSTEFQSLMENVTKAVADFRQKGVLELGWQEKR